MGDRKWPDTLGFTLAVSKSQMASEPVGPFFIPHPYCYKLSLALEDKYLEIMMFGLTRIRAKMKMKMQLKKKNEEAEKKLIQIERK